MKRYFYYFKLIYLPVLISLFIFSCKKNDPRPGKPKTIYETIASDGNYSFLAVAVTKAGLADALNADTKSGLTLFAPTNDAFKLAGYTSINDLSKIPTDVLKSILLYHVLGTEIKSGDIPQASNTPVNTLNGSPVYVTRTTENKVFVNGVKVIKANIGCTNGIIHAINRVLFPATGNIVQTAQGNKNLSLLVAAVLRASQGTTNVAQVLSGAGPFTVFAPTNDAFKKAGLPDETTINNTDPNTLAGILTYHVIAGRIFSSDLADGIKPATVQGETVTITLSGGAKVKGNANTSASNIIATDIVADNGVVHVIDQVLLP
ncbi:MAG: fasciclin domain-containing protein [Bacteroidetes bacterium]|nr:fasciclin domain-containing protein [Bacteroidota bacterium]